MADLNLSDRLRARLQRQLGMPIERRLRAPLRRMRNAGREYRPLFVTGASGSATSLLAVSLGQRFECAGVVYECDVQIGERSFLHVPALKTFASVAEYLAFIRPRGDWALETGRADLQNMFRAYARFPGEVMVAKGPDIHLVRAQYLQRCFPEAHFVAIFRDPVANIEGLRRKWPLFGRDSLAEVIRFYREIHEHFLAVAERAPERFLLVDYDRFVEQTEEVLHALGGLLGLARTTRIDRTLHAPNVEGQGVRNVRNGRISMVGDANQEARQRLPAGEATTIEEALGPLLERLRGASVTF